MFWREVAIAEKRYLVPFDVDHAMEHVIPLVYKGKYRVTNMRAVALASKALSRPSSRKGRMEKPLIKGNVTVCPSLMSFNTSGRKSVFLNEMACFMFLVLHVVFPCYALMAHLS